MSRLGGLKTLGADYGFIDTAVHAEVGSCVRYYFLNIALEMAWSRFGGHHDRPHYEVRKNGAPWQINGGNFRVNLKLRLFGV